MINPCFHSRSTVGKKCGKKCHFTLLKRRGFSVFGIALGETTPGISFADNMRCCASQVCVVAELQVKWENRVRKHRVVGGALFVIFVNHHHHPRPYFLSSSSSSISSSYECNVTIITTILTTIILSFFSYCIILRICAIEWHLKTRLSPLNPSPKTLLRSFRSTYGRCSLAAAAFEKP